MCGIFAVLDYAGSKDLRRLTRELGSRVRHRGPDWSGVRIFSDTSTGLAHERLAVVDLDTGAQPISDVENDVHLCVNGEIYNHLTLREEFKDYKFSTKSDCEVIIPLYLKYGTDFVNKLDGMFSFVLYDHKKHFMMAVRDPIGITTLYYGFGEGSSRYFASEVKSIHDSCWKVVAFPPGHLWTSGMDEPERYYNPKWWDPTSVPTKSADLALIRETFENSVKKRLMSDVPYGVLLSGGLDSSLVASIAKRFVDKMRVEGYKDGHEVGSAAWWPSLHSFSIGLPGSPDLAAAEKVAKHIGTIHHSFTFTVEDGIDALHDVITALETYDVTTIRASTPMFLMSRKIKAMGVKMVLSGEGADEILGGYLYFHRAPDAKSFHEETVMRVKNLHVSDCLRANKSTMAWGLEARVPFLDKDYLDVAMDINPEEKMHTDGRIEKHLMRAAFDDKENPYLPAEVLWRQKEQFSDGVGYSWIDGLKEFADKRVSDHMFSDRANRFPKDTPRTKEAYLYRMYFEEIFPSQAVASTVINWVPKEEWGCDADPSGRAQAVHSSAYDHVKSNGTAAA
eukprot:Clim_evm48s150 gene=Clim_evmTU48s150